ncbi:AAA family ATPase [Bradymonas sediminis]|uniref:Uncharacterized protein n=1 Tax=Bradymonas sediminis TaxID=1548548 RepID=A0A2Z4FMR0_9DELT|nr:ATP-dependent Clp protease ATP-binding subunit [Bradymonas sediminis]AWV90277.1 hypothetical protein DN745_13425 [Bradymonas sediminis]TDP75755.1 ATP-dependent Clp protease ATP-binding subunit ClpC [Bradymonas sediminis]
MKPLAHKVLFGTDGTLKTAAFSAEARALLERMGEWLQQIERRIYLPLDLLIILLEYGSPDLDILIAEGSDGVVKPADVLPRLRVLAREIEEEPTQEAPVLHREFFSRGFIRILEEAYDMSRGAGEATIGLTALARCVSWRAEATESASIRWAIRRLSEGKGDQLFDKKGLLAEPVFGDSAWRILQGAMQIAVAHGTPFLGTPHLIAMLCSVNHSIMWRAAKARGLEPGRLRDELLRLIGNKPDPIPAFLVGRKTLTPRMIRMLSFAAERAEEGEVGERDLIEAFLEDGGSSLELIQALGLESEIRQALGDPKMLEQEFAVDAAIDFAAKRQLTPTLDMLGRDLTEEAILGSLPPIVGRDIELQRVINILLRREQRNPLLCGEAGVGKTALAVGLAQRIALGQVPKKLQGYRVIELNGASLMSGTSYRGDLELRIKSLLEESRKDVILFIDEAHAVFAPRSSSNSPAAVPNHFKRALASGDIAVVGATTEAEYHRWFEQDSALKRRFERIEIKEPTEPMVRDILSALAPEFEVDYEVAVDAAAIEAAIELSVRYLPEQRLPDKAKKLLMDACIARANDLEVPGQAQAVGEVGAQSSSQASDDGQIGDERSDADERDPSKLMETNPLAPDVEVPPMQKIDFSRRVGRDDVARQVHMKTGIPLDRLLRGEINWWVGIEARLGARVLGQKDSIRQIAHALVSSRLRNAGKMRPMAVLLFVGPAGVGKSTLARALAQEVFDDPKALLRVDMNDFQEAHSISRLIGSPPGYVGYEDEDLFVTPLRRRPSSVVLFEDFDRAHPQIQSRILRLIDDGEIVDTRGHRADVRNSLFILTVHADTDRSAQAIGFAGAAAGAPSASGPGKGNEAALRALPSGLASQLRDPIDAAVAFHSLGQGGDVVLELLEQRTDAFIEALRNEYRLAVQIDASLTEYLREQASQVADARAVEALISEHLYQPVTQALLNGEGGASPRLFWDARRAQVRVAPSDT